MKMIPKSSTIINKKIISTKSNINPNLNKNPNTTKIFNHKINNPPHLNLITIADFFDNFFSDLLDQTTQLNSDFSKTYTNKINEKNNYEDFPSENPKKPEKNSFQNFTNLKKKLENYFFFSTFKSCMFVQSLKVSEEINSENNFEENISDKQIEHGKIDLTILL